MINILGKTYIWLLQSNTRIIFSQIFCFDFSQLRHQVGLFLASLNKFIVWFPIVKSKTLQVRVRGSLPLKISQKVKQSWHAKSNLTLEILFMPVRLILINGWPSREWGEWSIILVSLTVGSDTMEKIGCTLPSEI